VTAAWEPGHECPGATAHQWTASTSPGVWRSRCGRAVTTRPPLRAPGTGCAACARIAALAATRDPAPLEDPR